MKDIGKKSLSAAIYGAFDLGDQPKDDVPSDVIERLIAIDPVIANKIENGKAEIHYDFEIKGKDAGHKFDAAISGRRQLALVKYYRDKKEIEVDNLARLRDDIFDICTETKLKRMQLIVLGNGFTSAGTAFINDMNNWHSGKCQISRSLVQLSGSSYLVQASSSENVKPGVSSKTSGLIETRPKFLSSKLHQQPLLRKAIISVAIAAISLLAVFAYVINYQGSLGPSGGSYAAQLVWSIKNNITGNWTITIIAIAGGGLAKINSTWIVAYNTLHPTGGMSPLSNESQLLFQPFRLSLLTPGVYHHGIRFCHSADPDFYENYYWVNRSDLRAGDFFAVGDFFVLNKTDYRIYGEEKTIGYQQVYDEKNATWHTEPIIQYYGEKFTLWYSESDSNDPNVALQRYAIPILG